MGTVSTTLPSDGQTIDAADVNTPFNAILGEFNGNIDDNNIKTGANISGTKLGALTTPLSVLDADARGGWVAGVLAAPNTVTYNGNRSYDLVFNTVDYTDELSNGMRVKLARTVTPPTQCTDLEASSSQYWSKTSPAGITFTTTFTCAAWIKLESYGTAGWIINRMNALVEGWGMSVESDGRITILGRRIAANNKQINSYQSVPLNKWVHVAACLDMTVGDTTAQKIWIDGVEVPRSYTLTGTATAIVQGTTALTVGARSDGANPFDGKIAQASVHSACLSTAQIQAMASQTIDSSSPSIVSGFTMNGAATDVTANANDLTASGGAGYGTDSPFNATEYGIITANSFSTNTTLTVQVPEGYAIPTSGGVSSVFYSTQDVPYGFPRDKGRWAVETVFGITATQASPAAVTWYNTNFQIKLPVGEWNVSYTGGVQVEETSGTVSDAHTTLSTSTSTGTDSRFGAGYFIGITGATAVNAVYTATAENYITTTSATDYYILMGTGTASTNNLTFRGHVTTTAGTTLFAGNIRALLAYV